MEKARSLPEGAFGQVGLGVLTQKQGTLSYTRLSRVARSLESPKGEVSELEGPTGGTRLNSESESGFHSHWAQGDTQWVTLARSWLVEGPEPGLSELQGVLGLAEAPHRSFFLNSPASQRHMAACHPCVLLANSV